MTYKRGPSRRIGRGTVFDELLEPVEEPGVALDERLESVEEGRVVRLPDVVDVPEPLRSDDRMRTIPAEPF